MCTQSMFFSLLLACSLVAEKENLCICLCACFSGWVGGHARDTCGAQGGMASLVVRGYASSAAHTSNITNLESNV